VFSQDDIETSNGMKVPSFVLFKHSGETRVYTPGATKTRSIPDPRNFKKTLTVADGDPINVKPPAQSSAPAADGTISQAAAPASGGLLSKAAAQTQLNQATGGQQ
jgi:hypothetical protein